MKTKKYIIKRFLLFLVTIFLLNCGGENGKEVDADAEQKETPQEIYDGQEELIDVEAISDEIPFDGTPGDEVSQEQVEDMDASEDISEEPTQDLCEEEIARIASETSGSVISCSAVVRLDYETLTIIGWQLFCGHYAHPDEATARATAQSDTGYGENANMLNPPNPHDEYVFYEPPSDFGGAAIVSARNGLSLFGGSIVWAGTGSITYPPTWRNASELGVNCPQLPERIPAVGYDLRSGGSLSEAEIKNPLDIVWQTALPTGMATSNYLFDAVVLLYPPSMGDFDPSSAEWIVILNSGWLE